MDTNVARPNLELPKWSETAGSPSVPIKWEVSAQASAPVWDIYADASERQEFARDSHLQQAYTTSGKLMVAGETYRLDGVGYKDHSSGVRRWDGYGSHHFVLVHMPGWTMHLVMLYGSGGEPKGPMGAIYRDGETQGLAASELPPIEDALGGPNECELVVTPAGGEPITLQVEVLHQCPITVTDEGDNVNGIDWESESAATIVVMESAARFTGPNGEVGNGFFERGVRLENLVRPASLDAVGAPQPA